MNRPTIAASIFVVAAWGSVHANDESWAAQEPPAFAGETELVTVDVIVTDGRGRPVSALSAQDFVLTEDGRPRSVDTFEAIEVGGPAEAPAAARPEPPRVSTNTAERARPGRSFLLAFDDLNLTPADAELAKKAMTSFLENVREGDWIGVVATSGSVWWSTRSQAEASELHGLLSTLKGLKVSRGSMDFDQMTDYEAMRIVVHNDQQVLDRVAVRWDQYASRATGEGIDHPSADTTRSEARQLAIQVFQTARQRTQATLALLQRAAQSLALGRGRKSIVLLSDGFLYDSEIRGFNELTAAAQRANVTFYFLDVRGLRGAPGAFDATTVGAVPDIAVANVAADLNADEDGSSALAADTGGFTLRNTNDLAGGLERIARESQTYYLLGFKPDEKAADGRFHKIQVKVKRDGVKVVARKGYYARKKGEAPPAPLPGGLDPAVRQAFDSPFLVDQIPARMSAYVFDPSDSGKTRTLVVAELDIAALPLEEKQGRFVGHLEISLAATERATGHQERFDEKRDVSFSAQERDALKTGWYPVARMLDLSPGDYQIKLVARDTRSKRMGSIAHAVQVPPPGIWRVSTPTLTDVVRKEGPTPVPIPVARRAFARGATLYCKFEVFGTPGDGAGSPPRVSAGYAVRTADGRPTAARSDMVPIKPSAQGRLSRILGFSLAGWEPGSYELELTVTDDASGKKRELREPFTVTAGD